MLPFKLRDQAAAKRIKAYDEDVTRTEEIKANAKKAVGEWYTERGLMAPVDLLSKYDEFLAGK